MKLSKIKGADGDGDVAGAAEALHELKIEMYGSMDQKGKLEFILDQVCRGAPVCGGGQGA